MERIRVTDGVWRGHCDEEEGKSSGFNFNRPSSIHIHVSGGFSVGSVIAFITIEGVGSQLTGGKGSASS